MQRATDQLREDRLSEQDSRSFIEEAAISIVNAKKENLQKKSQ